jgi:hypothetical protein
MEDVSDLTFDDSKPAATITIHNNESKAPISEPSTNVRQNHEGNKSPNIYDDQKRKGHGNVQGWIRLLLGAMFIEERTPKCPRLEKTVTGSNVQ